MIEIVELEKKLADKNDENILTWQKFRDDFTNSIIDTMNKYGAYTPQFGEQHLQNVNIDPKKYTQQDITDMLENPSKNSKQLSSLSQYLENVIFQYKRAIKHFATILTFRNDLRCVSPINELKNESMFKLAYNRCLGLLRELNMKSHKDKIMKKVLTEGAYFCYIKSNDEMYSNDNYVIKGGEIDLLEIPSSYCYITGRTPYGFTYAINLAWFDRLLNAETLAPELYAQYRKFVELRDLSKSVKIPKETILSAQYYAVEMTKGFVFIADELRPQVIPPFQGLFKDALNISEYKTLLKQKSTLDTWKMICLMIPRTKDDNPAISFKEASMMANAIQSAAPSGTKFFSSPMEPVPIDFANAQNQNNITGLGEQSFWRTVGVNGSITDMGEKSAASLSFGLESDYSFVEHMYRQFENFVNIQLYLISKKIQFRISYYGNLYTEKEELKNYAELFRTANFPVGKLFGFAGYEPYEVHGVLKQEEILGTKDLMKPILSAFNTKGFGSKKESGRPKKNVSELQDDGDGQREYDSNATDMR